MMIDNKVLEIYKAQMTSQESRTSEPLEKTPYLCSSVQSRHLETSVWVEVRVGDGVGGIGM